MLRSFGDRKTESVFFGEIPKGISKELATVARGKLLMIKSADSLTDLRIPPSNHLEKLKGTDLYSIRVNKQFRIVFRWSDGGADDVSIADYH